MGLDESALGNVAGLPIDDRAAAAHVRSGAEPTPLRMNCSGKHAGMVATCVANGWAIDGYLDETHPLQVAITDEVARRTGAVHHVGVDGCGAPAHHVTLRGLAGALAAIAAGAGRAPTAMRTHPDLVGGEHRFVTMLMRAVPGLFAKDGAEGCSPRRFPTGVRSPSRWPTAISVRCPQ
ncbi:MAG: asparaginase [Ilumatobacteraceae bacterium]